MTKLEGAAEHYALAPRWSSVEEFTALLRNDYTRYGKVLEDAGLKPSL